MRAEFLPDLGACRLCGATTRQREHWRESFLGAGQSLRRCGHCAAVYLGPDLTPEALADFYAHDYRRLFLTEITGPDLGRFFQQRCENEFAQARLERLAPFLPTGGALFELGSGFGGFLGTAARVRPDLALHASEQDEAHRQAGCPDAAVNWVASYTDLAGLHRFDAVVAFHVLEHLPRPAAFARWAARMLKADGCLMIEVPDAGGPWPTRKLAHPAHLTYFTAATLRRMLDAAGFDVRHCGPHPGGLPFADTLLAVVVARSGMEAKPVAAASAAEIDAMDRQLDAVAWRWTDHLKEMAKGGLVHLAGAERTGALLRWLAYRRLRNAWHGL